MSGPGPGSGGPYYFAWTDAGTAFSSAHYVEDEQVFAFRLRHAEGQMPTLEIKIANPGVGLLSVGRKQWFWFSWWNGTSVVPLALVRLVGVPSDLLGQVVTLQLIARAPDHVARKQALAETLKTARFYDPIFLDDSHRDDPDAILEAYAAAWHIDRTSLAWTISDIIVGEDGTASFSAGQVPRDSVSIAIKQQPLTAVRVDANAKWSQVSTGGAIKLGPWTIATYTGASLIDEWPKAGASIGGGWIVQASTAVDIYGIAQAPTISTSYSWKNADTKHREGDTMSLNASQSRPYFIGSPSYIPVLLTWESTGGVQANASSRATYLWLPQWKVQASLYLQYKADRKRAEQLSFTLQADMQPILTDPTVQQDAEIIKINTVELSAPLIDYKNWTVLAGRHVEIGQICLPNNPTSPGGTSYQICVADGVCGSAEPDFSDTIGAPTDDGAAVWACLGASLPSIGDWSPATAAALGTLIAPSTPSWVYYSALLPPTVPYRTSGVQVAEGVVIRADNNSSFQVCTIGGATGYTTPPAFSPVWGVTTVDGGVEWTSLGPTLPGGAFQICVEAGTSALQLPPPWSAVAGDRVNDGGIVWQSLGMGGPSISIPAGGTVGNVLARSFFPTARGNLAIQYLIMKARARLLTRARAVEISFEAPFAQGVGLSCRMNATIEDPRFPGGSATGKIIAYELSCDGATGEAKTKVTIGCAIGNGGAPVAVAGVGVYDQGDYFLPGEYQQETGATALAASSDVGYSPPLDNPNDDGLIFPLDAAGVVLNKAIVGTLAAQEAAIKAAIPLIQREAALQARAQLASGSAQTQLDLQAQIAALGNVSIDQVLSRPGNSIYPDLQLRSLTGAAFTTVYALATTPLSVPKLYQAS